MADTDQYEWIDLDPAPLSEAVGVAEEMNLRGREIQAEINGITGDFYTKAQADSRFANIADTEAISGAWTFSNGLTVSSGNVLIGTTTAATGNPRLDILGGIVGANTVADATGKITTLSLRHFTNAEEPVLIVGGNMSSSINRVDIGGGQTGFNATTAIAFYTAANTTTLVGTLAADIAGVGTASVLRLRGDITIDKDLNHDGDRAGFYATVPIAKPTGVAVTAAGIHAALVSLGLIAA